CPTGCFGDQPLIGADANGVYIATNAFLLPRSGFRGAQLYAISWGTLKLGAAEPSTPFTLATSMPHPALRPDRFSQQQFPRGARMKTLKVERSILSALLIRLIRSMIACRSGL